MVRQAHNKYFELLAKRQFCPRPKLPFGLESFVLRARHTPKPREFRCAVG